MERIRTIRWEDLTRTKLFSKAFKTDAVEDFYPAKFSTRVFIQTSVDDNLAYNLNCNHLFAFGHSKGFFTRSCHGRGSFGVEDIN